MSRSSRAPLVVVAVVVAAVLGAVYLRSRATHDEAPPAPEPASVVTPAAAPEAADVPRAAPIARAPIAPVDASAPREERRDGGMVYIDGQGFARVDPVDPEAETPVPVPPGEHPAEPDVTPRLPITSEWRLQQTARLVTTLQQRTTRLEQEIRDAEQRGDADTARQRRFILERTRRHITELEAQVVTLRREVADGGASGADGSAGAMSSGAQ